MAQYTNLAYVFDYLLMGQPDKLRALVVELAQPDDAMAAGGSSFALTVRPNYALWLSTASVERLGRERLEKLGFDVLPARDAL
jgi:hypothetical protein